MAVDVAVVEFVVNKLGDLLIEKVAFLRGVRVQVVRLRDELNRMKSFLKDAAMKQVKDERIRQWITDVRDIALDAEDAIDTFLLKVERKRRGLLGSFPISPNHLHKIGTKIASIQARLDDIVRSREIYGIENLEGGGSSTADVEWRRRLPPWQRDRHLVGLEEDVEVLLRDVILEERQGLSIATIVGMGGIGKSTLARRLYNDNRVAEQFDCRAWVVISSEFSPRKIIKELMLQILRPNEDKLHLLELMEKLELHGLKEMLHQRLQEKRYFIIVDDVWEDEHIDFIKDAFPDEDDKAGRLVITSRNQIATKYAPYVHQMKLLDSNQSWELLLKKALIEYTENNFSEKLERIGKEILKKCGGLPLAISVVGGLLADKRPSKRRWKTVLREINSCLQESGTAVSSILDLSYGNLSRELKLCFLCLVFFEEDSIIRVEKLVHLWIAHGLIRQECRERTMEETGRGLLDNLINRNMIQIKDISRDEQLVETCQIHDLIRELCITKAKEEMRFQILKEGNPESSNKPVRHYVVRSLDLSTINHLARGNKYLHSLVIFHEADGDCHIHGNPSIWKSLVLLKVLDFEDFFLGEVPETIGSMANLRYLGLRKTGIRKLPSSFRDLKALEVLDISGNPILRVPSVIWQMDRLRHLYISTTAFGLKKSERHLQKGSLMNLQTLTTVSIDESVISYLTLMPNLRKLGLELMGSPKSYFSNLCTTLARLKNLDCLALQCFDELDDMDGLGNLHSVTRLELRGNVNIGARSAIRFPPNLCSLTITDYPPNVSKDPMPVLERLPKLVYLELSQGKGLREMVVSHDGFPSLEILSLRWMRDLENIQVRDGGLPELTRFDIYNCPAVENNIPQQLRSITNIIF